VRSSSRKWVFGMVAALAILVPAGLAWACVGLVVFNTTGSPIVQPGGTVEVFGGEFARGKPVNIHLDSPDGPILATVPDPMPSTMTSRFTLQVPIPPDITPGQHLLVANQEHYDMNAGIPARAAIYVNTQPPVAPTPSARATSLTVGDAPSPTNFVLIGLGVAAAGLLLAAVAAKAADRRSSPSQTERPSAS
jgi:hypothetical protein